MEAPFVLFFSTLLVIWYVHIIGVGHFILFFTVWSLMFSKTLESSGIHLKSIAYKTWPIWIQSHKNHMMQHSTQQLSFLLGHHEHLGLGILGAGSPSLASPLPFCTMFFINLFNLFKVSVSQIIGRLTSSTPFLTNCKLLDSDLQCT